MAYKVKDRGGKFKIWNISLSFKVGSIHSAKLQVCNLEYIISFPHARILGLKRVARKWSMSINYPKAEAGVFTQARHLRRRYWIQGPAACTVMPQFRIQGPAACAFTPQFRIQGPAACAVTPQFRIQGPAACAVIRYVGSIG